MIRVVARRKRSTRYRRRSRLVSNGDRASQTSPAGARSSASSWARMQTELPGTMGQELRPQRLTSHEAYSFGPGTRALEHSGIVKGPGGL